MPELPEVETIVRELQPFLQGKQIQAIDILWPNSVAGEPAELSEKLINQKITQVFRRGKYICVNLDSCDTLTIHLRMTGKFLFSCSREIHRHCRIKLHFTDQTCLYFIDMRKFGKFRWWPKEQPLLPDLGIEPLDFQSIWDIFLLLKSQRPIKTLLLDQTILAGIGNIYADESLFAARIHPQTPFNDVSSEKLKQLACVIPKILNTAIGNKGTTISDYRTTGNQSGFHQHSLYVYGREGNCCYICQTAIQRIKLNGRSSHFCPLCQAR
jgi:formamidopyrimidine-DNA glycosylase